MESGDEDEPDVDGSGKYGLVYCPRTGKATRPSWTHSLQSMHVLPATAVYLTCVCNQVLSECHRPTPTEGLHSKGQAPILGGPEAMKLYEDLDQREHLARLLIDSGFAKARQLCLRELGF